MTETMDFAGKIDKLLNKSAPKQTLEKGILIFFSKKVNMERVNWNSGTASFKVQGTNLYTVKLWFSTRKKFSLLHYECTCPYPMTPCKHQVAALFALQNAWKEKEGASGNLRVLPDSQESAPDAIPEKGSVRLTMKNKNTMHPASKPYLIPDLSSLTQSDLYNHVASASRDPDALEEYSLTFRPHTIFAQAAFISGWRSRETFEVVLKQQENDLAVTCSCNRKVKKLCLHGYSVLYELMETRELFLKMLNPDLLAIDAKRIMERLGLPADENWEKFLAMQYDEDGLQFIPTGKYKGLSNPNHFNQELLSAIVEGKPEKELQIPSPQEVYHQGYCFFSDPETKGLSIVPIAGVLGPAGKSFQKKIKPVEKVADVGILEYEDTDFPLMKVTRRLRHHSFNSREQEDVFSERFHLLHSVADVLENHPRLYIYQGANNPQFHVSKKDLKPVKMVCSSPPVKMVLTEEDGFITASPHLFINNRLHPLRSPQVHSYESLCLEFGDTLYLHSSLRETLAFEVMLRNEPVMCATAKFPEMAANYLAKLAPKYEIDFSGISSFNIETKKLSPVQRSIYLSEVGNFVIFKPVVQYKKNHQVEVLSGHDVVDVVKGKSIRKLQRDREFELHFLNDFRQLHPVFEIQQRSDFFHLTFEDFSAGQWFLKAFPKMQEMGIEVFGWKEMKNFKVNPHPPKISFSVNHKTDWFEAKAEIVIGDTRISLANLKKRFSPADGYVKLDDGTMGMLPEEWVKKLESIFQHSDIKGNKLKISDKLFSLVDDLFDNINDEDSRAFIEEKKQKLLNFNKIQQQPVPEGIHATLRHYQEDGYNWLCFLDEFGWGGILADDMGLGKTLEMITFLKKILENNSQTNLIVVPTSLLFNWENELKKFAPDIKVHFYYGQDRIKNTSEFDQYEIIFTSYGLMANDIKLLSDYRFNYVVLDESQAIKNPASRRYKAARLLQANNRITLTGTPIENNTFDLYAQMSFLNPGLLGSAASFKSEYAKPIDQQRNEAKAASLQKIINPFVLRRTKEQVATELPDKTEDIIYCEMKAPQRKVYDAFRNNYRNRLLKKIEQDGLAKARFSVLEGLTKLRQICDTPEILNEKEKYEGHSTKIEELLRHIKEKTGNHKLLVFSQFVQMLKVIERNINNEGICYEYLDGKSSVKARLQSVHNFQTDANCRVFLISLKAGGTGLNLTAADYVYIVDPWWNPAVENQAIDRCYRIGQDKKVIAYRMICKDTVEEKILQLQEKKRAVASEIISTDENVLKQLGKKDIMGLFG
ncbi:MAG: DEAD/DEAH box helicase [Bacteroidia bacterium]